MEKLIITSETYGYLIFDNGNFKCLCPGDTVEVVSSTFKYIPTTLEKMNEAYEMLVDIATMPTPPDSFDLPF